MLLGVAHRDRAGVVDHHAAAFAHNHAVGGHGDHAGHARGKLHVRGDVDAPVAHVLDGVVEDVSVHHAATRGVYLDVEGICGVVDAVDDIAGDQAILRGLGTEHALDLLDQRLDAVGVDLLVEPELGGLVFDG